MGFAVRLGACFNFVSQKLTPAARRRHDDSTDLSKEARAADLLLSKQGTRRNHAAQQVRLMANQCIKHLGQFKEQLAASNGQYSPDIAKRHLDEIRDQLKKFKRMAPVPVDVVVALVNTLRVKPNDQDQLTNDLEGEAIGLMAELVEHNKQYWKPQETQLLSDALSRLIGDSPEPGGSEEDLVIEFEKPEAAQHHLNNKPLPQTEAPVAPPALSIGEVGAFISRRLRANPVPASQKGIVVLSQLGTPISVRVESPTRGADGK